MIEIGFNVVVFQAVDDCIKAIRVKFKLPETAITGKTIKLIATSYEIICAADLNAPKKAYFELLDQPATIKP